MRPSRPATTARRRASKRQRPAIVNTRDAAHRDGPVRRSGAESCGMDIPGIVATTTPHRLSFASAKVVWSSTDVGVRIIGALGTTRTARAGGGGVAARSGAAADRKHAVTMAVTIRVRPTRADPGRCARSADGMGRDPDSMSLSSPFPCRSRAVPCLARGSSALFSQGACRSPRKATWDPFPTMPPASPCHARRDADDPTGKTYCLSKRER